MLACGASVRDALGMDVVKGMRASGRRGVRVRDAVGLEGRADGLLDVDAAAVVDGVALDVAVDALAIAVVDVDVAVDGETASRSTADVTSSVVLLVAVGAVFVTAAVAVAVAISFCA